jgi:hypothetical protein
VKEKFKEGNGFGDELFYYLNILEDLKMHF